jgi:excisionase family DNA binding protein
MSERATIPPAERFFVRQEEAAALLSISTRQLRKLTRRGEIPAYGHGRSLRYAVEDLRRFGHTTGGGRDG